MKEQVFLMEAWDSFRPLLGVIFSYKYTFRAPLFGLLLEVHNKDATTCYSGIFNKVKDVVTCPGHAWRKRRFRIFSTILSANEWTSVVEKHEVCFNVTDRRNLCAHERKRYTHTKLLHNNSNTRLPNILSVLLD